MDTPLYNHQQALVDQNPHKIIIAHQVGTGKTRTSLELAKINGIHALVICPKSLCEKWKRDIVEWGASADVISKETFRRDYKILPRYDGVIVDEAHLMWANFKSQGHKALAQYFKVHNVEYRYLLTGTPFTSSGWSIFSLLKLIDVKLDFWSFRQQFFSERYFGSRVVFVPREGVEDALADLVRQHGSIVRIDDCIQLPEQSFIEEFFDLTKEQKKATEEMKTLEQNPIARFTKLHQIASGTLLGNEFTDTITMPALKNEYIRSKILENEKVIVFSRYNAHLDLLADMCKKEGVPYRMIRGDVVDRDAVVRECEEAKRMVVLINTGCSVGYELPSFPITIFASLSYSFVDFTQACGRVMRINRPKKNLYITLITRKSADVPVLESIRRKESFSEAIFARDSLDTLE